MEKILLPKANQVDYRSQTHSRHAKVSPNDKKTAQEAEIQDFEIDYKQPKISSQEQESTPKKTESVSRSSKGKSHCSSLPRIIFNEENLVQQIMPFSEEPSSSKPNQEPSEAQTDPDKSVVCQASWKKKISSSPGNLVSGSVRVISGGFEGREGSEGVPERKSYHEFVNLDAEKTIESVDLDSLTLVRRSLEKADQKAEGVMEAKEKGDGALNVSEDQFEGAKNELIDRLKNLRFYDEEEEIGGGDRIQEESDAKIGAGVGMQVSESLKIVENPKIEDDGMIKISDNFVTKSVTPVKETPETRLNAISDLPNSTFFHQKFKPRFQTNLPKTHQNQQQEHSPSHLGAQSHHLSHQNHPQTQYSPNSLKPATTPQDHLSAFIPEEELPATSKTLPLYSQFSEECIYLNKIEECDEELEEQEYTESGRFLATKSRGATSKSRKRRENRSSKWCKAIGATSDSLKQKSAILTKNEQDVSPFDLRSAERRQEVARQEEEGEESGCEEIQQLESVDGKFEVGEDFAAEQQREGVRRTPRRGTEENGGSLRVVGGFGGKKRSKTANDLVEEIKLKSARKRKEEEKTVRKEADKVIEGPANLSNSQKSIKRKEMYITRLEDAETSKADQALKNRLIQAETEQTHPSNSLPIPKISFQELAKQAESKASKSIKRVSEKLKSLKSVTERIVESSINRLSSIKHLTRSTAKKSQKRAKTGKKIQKFDTSNLLVEFNRKPMYHTLKTSLGVGSASGKTSRSIASKVGSRPPPISIEISLKTEEDVNDGGDAAGVLGVSSNAQGVQISPSGGYLINLGRSGKSKKVEFEIKKKRAQRGQHHSIELARHRGSRPPHENLRFYPNYSKLPKHQKVNSGMNLDIKVSSEDPNYTPYVNKTRFEGPKEAVSPEPRFGKKKVKTDQKRGSSHKKMESMYVKSHSGGKNALHHNKDTQLQKRRDKSLGLAYPYKGLAAGSSATAHDRISLSVALKSFKEAHSPTMRKMRESRTREVLGRARSKTSSRNKCYRRLKSKISISNNSLQANNLLIEKDTHFMRDFMKDDDVSVEKWREKSKSRKLLRNRQMRALKTGGKRSVKQILENLSPVKCDEKPSFFKTIDARSASKSKKYSIRDPDKASVLKSFKNAKTHNQAESRGSRSGKRRSGLLSNTSFSTHNLSINLDYLATKFCSKTILEPQVTGAASNRGSGISKLLSKPSEVTKTADCGRKGQNKRNSLRLHKLNQRLTATYDSTTAEISNAQGLKGGSSGYYTAHEGALNAKNSEIGDNLSKLDTVRIKSKEGSRITLLDKIAHEMPPNNSESSANDPNHFFDQNQGVGLNFITRQSEALRRHTGSRITPKNLRSSDFTHLRPTHVSQPVGSPIVGDSGLEPIKIGKKRPSRLENTSGSGSETQNGSYVGSFIKGGRGVTTHREGVSRVSGDASNPIERAIGSHHGSNDRGKAGRTKVKILKKRQKRSQKQALSFHGDGMEVRGVNRGAKRSPKLNFNKRKSPGISKRKRKFKKKFKISSKEKGKERTEDPSMTTKDELSSLKGTLKYYKVPDSQNSKFTSSNVSPLLSKNYEEYFGRGKVIRERGSSNVDDVSLLNRMTNRAMSRDFGNNFENNMRKYCMVPESFKFSKKDRENRNTGNYPHHAVLNRNQKPSSTSNSLKRLKKRIKNSKSTKLKKDLSSQLHGLKTIKAAYKYTTKTKPQSPKGSPTHQKSSTQQKIKKIQKTGKIRQKSKGSGGYFKKRYGGNQEPELTPLIHADGRVRKYASFRLQFKELTKNESYGGGAVSVKKYSSRRSRGSLERLDERVLRKDGGDQGVEGREVDGANLRQKSSRRLKNVLRRLGKQQQSLRDRLVSAKMM